MNSVICKAYLENKAKVAQYFDEVYNDEYRPSLWTRKSQS
jgi:hypothetical protein